MAGAERESACAAPQARDNVGTDYNKRTSLPNSSGNPGSALEAPFAHYANPVVGHDPTTPESGRGWIRCREKFFLPVGLLIRLFRGKLLAFLCKAFASGEWKFFGQLSKLAESARFHAWLGKLEKTAHGPRFPADRCGR